MTDTAYIIIGGLGEYSDRREWPVRVFLSKEAAQAAMVLLETIEKKHYPINRIDGESWKETWARRKEIGKVAAAEYASAGYDVYDGEVDWQLAEAPLEQ